MEEDIKNKCACCHCHMPFGQFKCCEKCRSRDQERKKKRKENLLCVSCGSNTPVTHGFTTCEKCWSRGQDRTKKRKVNSLCVKCGKTPPVFGLKTCKKCTKSHRWSLIKGRSKRRKWPEIIKEDYARTLFEMPCFYCNGVEEHTKFNGIDRVDSSLGYTKENTVSCCYVCNKMKNDSTLDLFVERCGVIYKRLSVLNKTLPTKCLSVLNKTI